MLLLEQTIKDNQKKFLEFIKNYNEFFNLFKTFSKYATQMKKEFEKNEPFSNEYLLEKIKDFSKKINSKLTDLESSVNEIDTMIDSLDLSSDRINDYNKIKNNINEINNYMLSVKKELDKIEIVYDDSNISAIKEYVKFFLAKIEDEINAARKKGASIQKQYISFEKLFKKYLDPNDPTNEVLATNILNTIASSPIKYKKILSMLTQSYSGKSVETFIQMFSAIKNDLTNKYYKHLTSKEDKKEPQKQQPQPVIKQEKPEQQIQDVSTNIETPKKEQKPITVTLKKKSQQPQQEQPKEEKDIVQPGKTGENEKGLYVISYTKKPIYYDFEINDGKGNIIFMKGDKEVFRKKSGEYIS